MFSNQARETLRVPFYGRLLCSLEIRIALAPTFAQNSPMLGRLLSANALRSATADVNGIEAFPVEVEVNSG